MSTLGPLIHYRNMFYFAKYKKIWKHPLEIMFFYIWGSKSLKGRENPCTDISETTNTNNNHNETKTWKMDNKKQKMEKKTYNEIKYKE